MVHTRRGGQPDAAAQPTNDKENQTPTSDQTSRPAVARKRKADADEGPADKAKTARQKTSGKQRTDKKARAQVESASSAKPRLTAPDLEFDFDRSKLRDPRPTPGRKARPRYEEIDIPQDVLARLKATREIPKSEKPKGRLTAAQKEKLEEEETLMNPLAFSHDMYKCLAKGREGSPTYDAAGFELDYDKVYESIYQVYNKDRMVRGMKHVLDRMDKEEKEIYKLFFVDLKWKKKAKYEVAPVLFYIKDKVSKDLGVPLHQIKPKHLKDWRCKGHEPVKFEAWWQEPNKEEQKRELKLETGSDFRKDL